jgi:hypothetical protein
VLSKRFQVLHAAWLITRHIADTVLLERLQAMLPKLTKTQILTWFNNQRNDPKTRPLTLEAASQDVLDIRESLRKELQPPKQLQDTSVRAHSSILQRGFGFVYLSIAILYHEVPNLSTIIRNF